MRCIPCFAVMSVADREWVAARQQTVSFLKENASLQMVTHRRRWSKAR